jgi:hypothetical protein
MGVFDTMKAMADSLADKASQAKSAGVDVLRSMLQEISAAFQELEGVGYEVLDVELAVGLPPSVTVFLAKRGQPTDEAFAALLGKFEGRKTATTFISLVRQADQWSQSLQWGDRHCRNVAVDLGLRSAVRLVYSRPKSDSAPPQERRLENGASVPAGVQPATPPAAPAPQGPP